MFTGSANATAPVYRRRRRHMTLAVVLTLLCLALPLSAAAQNGTPSAAPAPPTPAGPADDLGRGTPRSAVRGLLEACWANDYERAANYLDLRRIPQASRQKDGPVLARQLSTVLDRTLWVDPEQLSDAPDGERDDGLPPRRDLVGVIQTAKAPMRVLLERVPREDGTLIWKVASETVAKIPELYQEFGYGPLGDLLPPPLFEMRFLQVQLWQWIAIVLLIVVSWLLSWLLTRLLVRIGHSIVERSHATLDDKLLATSVGPLRLTIGVLVFYVGTVALALSVRAQAFVGVAAKVVAVVAITWLLMRLVDALSQIIEGQFTARRQVALSFVPLGRRTVKVFLAVVAFVATLQSLSFNVTSLLAGLGIGGLAVALAAQKTVEHLFGSITLVADQPVRVGDSVRFGDKVGKVEDIGLRSTRIRTLDRTVVSVPNADFAAMQLENLSRRDRFWLQTTIGLHYDTRPEQLRTVLTELQKTLVAHPKVDQQQARIRFVGFGNASFRIEIYAYTLTADLNEFLAIREEIFLQAADIVNASGTKFAGP